MLHYAESLINKDTDTLAPYVVDVLYSPYSLRVRRAITRTAVLLGDKGRGWYSDSVPTQEVCGGAAASGYGEARTCE